VFALTLVVLGPAIAQSQILIICGVYRNSHPDTGNNVCHGTGPGCMEYTIIEMSTTGGGEEPVESRREGATMASHILYPVDSVQGPDLPVSLALHTGLRLPPEQEPVCRAPAFFDRVRVASKERVPPALRDRSRGREFAQVSAR
jgi:hypothetical protein